MLQQLKDIDANLKEKVPPLTRIANCSKKPFAQDSSSEEISMVADLKHACQFVNGKDKVDVAELKGFGKIVSAVLDFITT